MLLAPVVFAACCAAAARARVAANPPFFAAGAGAGAGPDPGLGAAVGAAVGFAFVVVAGLVAGLADAGARAVPLYEPATAGPDVVAFAPGVFVGCVARDVGAPASVFTVFDAIPEPPSSAFRFSVDAPAGLAGFALWFAIAVGFGLGAGDDEAAGLEAGDG